MRLPRVVKKRYKQVARRDLKALVKNLRYSKLDGLWYLGPPLGAWQVWAAHLGAPRCP